MMMGGWVDGWMDEKGREPSTEGGPRGTSLLYLSTSHSFAQTFQNNVAVTTLLSMHIVLVSHDVVVNAKKETNNKETETLG